MTVDTRIMWSLIGLALSLGIGSAVFVCQLEKELDALRRELHMTLTKQAKGPNEVGGQSSGIKNRVDDLGQRVVGASQNGSVELRPDKAHEQADDERPHRGVL